MKELCIFVCSCDKTYDVFTQTFERLKSALPVTELPCYVGINTMAPPSPFIGLKAPKSNWREEVAAQVRQLADEHRYILLILDDFFFHDSIGADKLRHYVDEMKRHGGHYLRLRPLERSILGKVHENIAGRSAGEFALLSRSEPYYSSLQVAIWQREHLLKALTCPGNIWDFEHLVLPESRHFALKKQVLRYDHLVEKGRWYKDAPRLLGKSVNDAAFARGFDNGWLVNARGYQRLKFAIVGYSIFRLRRLMAFHKKTRRTA